MNTGQFREARRLSEIVGGVSTELQDDLLTSLYPDEVVRLYVREFLRSHSSLGPGGFREIQRRHEVMPEDISRTRRARSGERAD